MSRKVYSVHAKGWVRPPICSPITLCNSRNCLCCKTLNVNCIFRSFTTGCTFAFTNPISFNLNCKSGFVIYLISCKKCGKQYVGQTRQPLHKRLNGHRSSIVNNKLSTVSELNSKEDFYMKVLNTFYPVGLNDRIQGEVVFQRIRNKIVCFLVTLSLEEKEDTAYDVTVVIRISLEVKWKPKKRLKP